MGLITTKKAIEKIALFLSPTFSSDSIKEKTLYCCDSCKPNNMMQSYMNDKSTYNNTQGISL